MSLHKQLTYWLVERAIVIISCFFIFAVIKILSLVKKITGIEDAEAAVREFKKNISSQNMYFNKDPLPANETGEQAFKLCKSIEGAMKFCPKRWETLQKWFKASREVSTVIHFLMCATNLLPK